MSAPTIPSPDAAKAAGYEVRDGLLWRGEFLVPKHNTDRVAQAYGFQNAEQMIEALTPPIMKAHRAERQAWILDWFKQPNNYAADAVNQEFHEAYHRKFPQYKRRETWWGSQPVSQAMTDLRAMAKAGILDANRIGLGANWQPGFPKWVMGYTLNKSQN